MNCVHCGYPSTHVTKTRIDDLNNVIKRRRECLRCSMRFTTHERIKDKNQKPKTYESSNNRKT